MLDITCGPVTHLEGRSFSVSSELFIVQFHLESEEETLQLHQEVRQRQTDCVTALTRLITKYFYSVCTISSCYHLNVVLLLHPLKILYDSE